MDTEAEEYKGHTIIYHLEECAPDPRKEYDHFGTLATWHRYQLGDKQPDESPKEWYHQFSKADVLLPVYMIDHSGLALRTTSFHDPWDSGQLGWIVATAEKIRKEYSVKRISAKLRALVRTLLKAEVEEYSAYLSGDVWWYEIEGTDDSCSGYYGYESVQAAARDAVDALEGE